MRKLCVLFLALTLMTGTNALAQTPAPALKIVVVKGEDAVNIIQQKTAVAPVVEVRDKNNLPVPGATVTFALSGQGGAFAGGAQSLTVVTNAAGQATAAGFTPTAAGAVNISATATFQGQTAIATIAQTNVMTAAEAASTAGAAGSGGGATGGGGGAAGGGAGGGAGAGGGMSGAMIGTVAGIAGAGALVGVKAAGGDDSSSGGTATTTSSPATTATAPTTTTPTSTTPTTTTPPATTPPPAATPQPTSASYSGAMDGTVNGTSTISFTDGTSGGLSCTFSQRQQGTATLRTTTTSGTGTGTLTMSGHETITATSCAELTGILADEPFNWTANVEVSGNNVRFTQEFRDSGSVPGASYSVVTTVTFTGTISGSNLTGTLTFNGTSEVRGDGFVVRGTQQGSMPINLRTQ
jgi:hypothetical protein